ncbi:Dual 3prime [Diplonema papillatum]|nr:Dual 3prime [Diplonema papillatum]
MLPNESQLTYDEFTNFMTDLIVQEQCTVPLRTGGTKWHVVKTGKSLNISDVYKDKRFKNNRLQDQYSGYQSRSILISPVKDANGKVIGLVELINKFKEVDVDDAASGDKTTGLEITGFTDEDERLLHMMCLHCSTFIAHAMNNE